MRKTSLCAVAIAAVAMGGCGSATTTFVKSDTTLGRVVVYRNGVAYFERTAEVQGDSLKLAVPDDKIDDFLKSLTVVDAATGQPAPISYPSGRSGGTIDMKVGLGSKPGPHKLRVSYVTEAPSWKPSYRVVVGKDGKVEVNGWAIVDNTSGEDWKDVKLGVGASSAMSFRFDLKGLRLVERETLQANDLFAQAPPMGGASYGQGGQSRGRVVADIADDTIKFADERLDGTLAGATADSSTSKAPAGRARHVEAKPATGMDKKGSGNAAGPPPTTTAQVQAQNEVQRMAQALQASGNVAVIEGYASSSDKDKQAASLERANKLREQLVRNGVDPNRVVAVGKGEQTGRSGGARVLETEKRDDGKKTGADAPKQEANQTNKEALKPSTEPIGTSHFESPTAMTVPKGTSAMVSILRSDTEGEMVYLYDAESPRGNTQFPFKTLRFKNPTDSALESGPVSVFGEGKFIGEGLAEPIPARSIAFVPFALDRQIVVERKDGEQDAIAKIMTVQRGVFHTEVKHTKKATFTLFNRLGEKATVFIKHTVAPGYQITKAPEGRVDHLAGASLFRVELGPNAKMDVTIEESTPVLRTTDIRTPAGLDLVRAYLSSAAVEGPLKKNVEHLLSLNADMAKVEQQIQTAREQMGEYRMRMDELHAQLVTLKAVKTAGPLMTHLEKKLQEVSEKLSKSTVDVVGMQEKLMVARVQFQTGVADLTLEKSDTREANIPK
jgi:outer membrane protein OmpA-like peptidoglycan-associated protein